jgi:outer membrane autotransporter protein
MVVNDYDGDGTLGNDPNGLSIAERNLSYEQVAFDELAATRAASTETTSTNIDLLKGRMIALRSGHRGVQLAGLGIRDSEGNQLRGRDLEASFAERLAAGDDPMSDLLSDRVGLWATGMGTWGDYDQTEEEAGFDIEDAWGIVGGIDYRFSEQVVAGISVGYSESTFDFDRNAGDLDKEAIHLAAYGTYQMERWYIDGVISYANIDYDLDRNIAYALGSAAPVTGTLAGDTDGDEFGVSVGVGYAFNRGAWEIEPYLRANWTHLDIDSYTEDGSGIAAALRLDFDDQTVRALSSDLGIAIRYALSTNFGVVTPYVRAEWAQEYGDDGRDLRATFVADPNQNGFAFRAHGPDRTYANIAAGLAATLSGGLSAFVDFETVLGLRSVDLYTLSAGLRYQF